MKKVIQESTVLSPTNAFSLSVAGSVMRLIYAGKTVIEHSPERPFVSAGRGTGKFDMFRGNYHVSEHLEELVALRSAEILEAGPDSAVLRFYRADAYSLEVHAAIVGGRLELSFSCTDVGANRWRFSLPAETDERVYGCGEQFSHLDLRGRPFPLWTGEQGVGRNKKTLVTWQADVAEGAGGDYFWTFFPQTSFTSSRRYWAYLETSAYSVFDFSAPDRHELYAWELPRRLVIGVAASMMNVAQDVSAFFGRQGQLPDWCYDGVILGIQGGTTVCLDKLRNAKRAGVPVCGIWAQDWQGIRMTGFGQRLQWNWVWDRERYPCLDGEIPRLEREGVRFLGYINPYVVEGRSLYREALERNFLARNHDGGPYLVDFGEFDAGIVDLSQKAAFDWYKGVIKQNLIDFGLSGWMADFGEYLPTDAVLASGRSAELAHNEWPAIWARCNREAVDESGRQADILYFMRAGGPGSQKDCPLMWAGDQNVDWSEDDGLPSVIPAALSLAMSGHGLHHSDMGGYTTLFGMKRTKELFMRWVEFSALTPLMRGHEGNRPKDNWQFDSDEETLAHLARMGRFHVALKPYLQAADAENAREGKPVMRPLFLHHEDDPAAWSIKDQYLLGADLLVAPVIREGATARTVHLPPGKWVELWTGVVHEIGTARVAGEPAGTAIEVVAPLGYPPAFYRADSTWAELFRSAVAAAAVVAVTG